MLTGAWLLLRLTLCLCWRFHEIHLVITSLLVHEWNCTPTGSLTSPAAPRGDMTSGIHSFVSTDKTGAGLNLPFNPIGKVKSKRAGAWPFHSSP